MDATEMKQLREAIDALSKAKQKDLRKPVPLSSLTMRERRRLCRKCAAVAEADMPGADVLVRAFILRQMAEAVYGGASGLDEKLYRYTKSLRRKLS